jgi:tetratricopeptide (TPR) repeat protein
MGGEFDKAFGYFSKATVAYKGIGDRISYAYTLWGQGTAYKMVGETEEALKCFLEAEAIFDATGDKRGKIYTLLGKGELACLRGEGAEANKTLQEALQIAEAHHFRVERCHGHLLQLIFRREYGEAVSLEEVREAYRELGTDFPQGDVSLPLNLP